MKKQIVSRYLFFILLILIQLILVSCADYISDDTMDATITNKSIGAAPDDLVGIEQTNAPFVSADVLTEKSPTELNPNVESSDKCEHEMPDSMVSSFHKFPGSLITYVGEDNFHEWILKTTQDNSGVSCAASIYSFIHYFKIPREVFDNLITYGEVMHDYNADILYSNDIKLVEEYYHFSQLESRVDSISKGFSEYIIKDRLISYVSKVDYDKWITSKQDKFVAKSSVLPADSFLWSIPEFVYQFNINQDELEKVLDIKNLPTFDYDIDAIYQNKDIINAKITSAKTIEDIQNITESIRKDGID